MAIQSGEYGVSASFKINGTPVPWWAIDLDMNIYSMSTLVRVRGPMDSGQKPDGSAGLFNAARVTDWSKTVQQINPSKWDLSIGYQRASAGPAGQLQRFESGIIDETNAEYDLNEWEFVGRSAAAIFQDNPTAATLPRNVTPLTLIEKFFGDHGIPLVASGGGDSVPLVMGKAFDDTNYQRSLRNSSEWDYMNDAAEAAGMKLFVRNGVGYFGPAGGSGPTVNLGFLADLDKLKISHAGRRAHDLQVRVDSSNPKHGTRVTATYGTALGPNAIVRRYFISGLDLHKAKGEAYAIWRALTTKEFIGDLTLYPDDAFMRMLAANGPNFLVTLGGVIPSHQQVYHVSQASVKIEAADDKDPTLSVVLAIENHVSAAGSGSLLNSSEASI